MSETLSHPKYYVVKDTYRIFNNRILTIRRDSRFRRNIHLLKYYRLMVKLRHRVKNLLKLYPVHQVDKKKSDPMKDNISADVIEHLYELSRPSKKFLIETLNTINRIIWTIIEDHFYQKNPLKFKRVSELMEYWKKVCRILKTYPENIEEEPQIEYRFKPSKRKSIKFKLDLENCGKSRRLNIQFDEATNKLAMPQYQRIINVLRMYKNFVRDVKKRLKTDLLMKNSIENHCVNEKSSKYKDSLKTKRKYLEELLEKLECRRDMLLNMKAQAECKKKVRTDKPDKGIEPRCSSPIPGSFDDRSIFTPFTNNIELPSRGRLQEVHKFYKNILMRMEKLENGPTGGHGHRKKLPSSDHSTKIESFIYAEDEESTDFEPGDWLHRFFF